MFESMIFLFPRWDMLVSWRVLTGPMIFEDLNLKPISIFNVTKMTGHRWHRGSVVHVVPSQRTSRHRSLVIQALYSRVGCFAIDTRTGWGENFQTSRGHISWESSRDPPNATPEEILRNPGFFSGIIVANNLLRKALFPAWRTIPFSKCLITMVN